MIVLRHQEASHQVVLGSDFQLLELYTQSDALVLGVNQSQLATHLFEGIFDSIHIFEEDLELLEDEGSKGHLVVVVVLDSRPLLLGHDVPDIGLIGAQEELDLVVVLAVGTELPVGDN